MGPLLREITILQKPLEIVEAGGIFGTEMILLNEKHITASGPVAQRLAVARSLLQRYCAPESARGRYFAVTTEIADVPFMEAGTIRLVSYKDVVIRADLNIIGRSHISGQPR